MYSTSINLINSNTEEDDPAFESDAYQINKYIWQFIDDMWEGRSAWMTPLAGITNPQKAMSYLPLEPAEPSEEWVKRVRRSYMDNCFREAIQSSAGFLDFSLNDDAHPSIVAHQNNIDGRGNSLYVFLRSADILSLKKERCGILVDFPKLISSLQTARDEIMMGRRPYLRLFDVDQIINWKEKETPTNQSGVQFEWVVLREVLSVPVGRFGSELKVQYRVLGEGWFEVWEDDGNNNRVLIEEGRFSLPVVPFVVYTINPNDPNPMLGKPTLYDLAELQLQLYQKQSNKNEILHKLCPFLTVQRAVKGEERDLAIGPNAVIWDVNATYVSPGSDAIAPIQQDIDKLYETIRLKTLAFQSGKFALTATEVQRDTATAQASLSGMAKAKQSAVEQVFSLWSAWMNAPGQGGGITVNERILRDQIDTATVNLYQQLEQSGNLTRETMLELLKDGKWFPESFEPTEESERIEANRPLSDYQLKLYDLLLKYQVISPDELATAIKSGQTIEELINLEERARERENIDRMPEGFTTQNN